MRAVTMRQPWAWAAIHGGMTTFNLFTKIPPGYVGPLIVQAGRHLADADAFQVVHDLAGAPPLDALVESAVVGVVELTAWHTPRMVDGRWPCCEPWGRRAMKNAGGRIVHLNLADPQPVASPIECDGKPGLWIPSRDLLDQVRAGLSTGTR